MTKLWAFLASILCFGIVYAERKPEIPYSNTIGYKMCQNKNFFNCVIVKDKKIGKKIVAETWEDLFSDEAERLLVMKLNRLNIKLEKGMPLAVPKEKNKTFADFSPFPPSIAEPKEKIVIFDPALLAWAAYSPEGNLIRWAPALGGMDYCKDTHRRCRTVVGSFKVVGLGNKHSVSNRYPVDRRKPRAKIPWVVWFYKNPRRLLYGIHSSNRMEGKHASHGCVRTFADDAKWLNEKFVKIGTRVIVRPYPPDENK